MSSISIQQTNSLAPARLVAYGTIGGLVGGLTFGILMGSMGMLPMVGMLVNSESAVVGFVVHMLISAFIGAVYGLAAGRLAPTWANAAIGGLINGIAWWVLGALLLMPLFLGMNEMIFVIGQPQWMSLVGHILFGLVAGFIFTALVKRS